MANTISYAEIFQEALAQKYTETGKAGALIESLVGGKTARTGLKWDSGKTVQIPRLDMDGLTDHDRNANKTPGDLANDFESKTMEHDRSQKFQVDPQDIDESNRAVSMANIANVFTTEKVIPEMDARVFSQIYSEFVSFGGVPSTTAMTVTTALLEFDLAMQALDDAETPMEGRLLYCTTQFNNLLKNAEQMSRQIDVNTNNGAVNRIISRLDTVEIIIVPKSRFFTGYDFTTGFVPAVGSFQLNFILIHPSAVTAPLKVAEAMLDNPSATTGGLYLWFYRTYFDCFLFERKANGVYINRGTTPTA